MSMKSWFLIWTLALCMVCAAASAQGGVLTRVIGGSDAESLDELALTAEGNIVAAGSTYSSDGTLSDRTKTGHTGWIACLDGEGNTLWNFCSRNSQNDQMLSPVVHEDGTITVLLRSDGHEDNQIELIRLSAQGEQLSRRTLMKLSQEEAHCALEWPGSFAGGYVVSRIGHDDEERRPTYTWYDFDGNVLKTSLGPWEGSVMAMGQSHVIEVHDEVYWLCRIDEKGNDTKLCRISNGDKPGLQYGSLISLADGGALACGGWGFGEDCTGVISRWDAEGKLLSEMEIDGYRLDDMEIAQGGYIVSGRDTSGVYALLRVSETGEVSQMAAPEGSVAERGRQMCVLPSGNVAVISEIQSGSTGLGWVNSDALLSVIGGL